MTTMKEMCETIVDADFLRNRNGSIPSAEQIFNSSPTGELFQVFEWYEQAKLIIAERGPTETKLTGERNERSESSDRRERG